KGKQPGIYHSWKECKEMINGFKNAQYKSFPDFESAKRAFNSPYIPSIGKKQNTGTNIQHLVMSGKVDPNSIAVDAASSGNPGVMEYRGVDTTTKKVLFHVGPFKLGTNNIGEFLAIVHGLAFLQLHKSDRIIYTDSRTA